MGASISLTCLPKIPSMTFCTSIRSWTPLTNIRSWASSFPKPRRLLSRKARKWLAKQRKKRREKKQRTVLYEQEHEDGLVVVYGKEATPCMPPAPERFTMRHNVAQDVAELPTHLTVVYGQAIVSQPPALDDATICTLAMEKIRAEMGNKDGAQAKYYKRLMKQLGERVAPDSPASVVNSGAESPAVVRTKTDWNLDSPLPSENMFSNQKPASPRTLQEFRYMVQQYQESQSDCCTSNNPLYFTSTVRSDKASSSPTNSPRAADTGYA